MNEETRFKEWCLWLRKIHEDELLNLLVHRHIYQEIRNIVKTNPNLHKPSPFYDWMARLYNSSALIGIRRLVDRDKRSISFTRILEEIISHPQVLSRDRYVSLWQTSTLANWEEVANKQYDYMIGESRKHIDPVEVEKELNKLERKAACIEEYATKRVAHYDKNAPKEVPTYQELDECMDYVEELTIKYWKLFFAEGYGPLLPTWQYDWTEIFRYRWIEETSLENDDKT